MLVFHCQQGSSTLNYSTFYPKPNSFQKLRLLVNEICAQFWDDNNGVGMVMYDDVIQAWCLLWIVRHQTYREDSSVLVPQCQPGSSAPHYSTFYPKPNFIFKSLDCWWVKFGHNSERTTIGVGMFMICIIYIVYGCSQAWFLNKRLKCFSFLDLKQQGSSALKYSTFYPKPNSFQKLRLLVSEIWADSEMMTMELRWSC